MLGRLTFEVDIYIVGFPDSSVGKESACNAGDPGSIPGLGRSSGEGIGYPLQYSWASLVAQLVKNLPAVWETWVQSLGWEDPLEKGRATHSSILAWRIPWTISSPWGHKELDTTEQLSLHFITEGASTGRVYATSISWGGLHHWAVWYVEGTAVVWCLGLILLSQGLGMAAAGGGRGSDSC